MKSTATIALLAAFVIGQGADDQWLEWTASRAQAIGKSAYVQGRVGGGVGWCDAPQLRLRSVWVVFPLTHSDGQPLFAAGDTHAELVVRIAGREGRVKWPIPPDLSSR